MLFEFREASNKSLATIFSEEDVRAIFILPCTQYVQVNYF
jgi:hypothetical protein